MSVRRAAVNGGGVAVVVGASGALGGAIATRLLAEGLTVVGVARSGAGQRPSAGDAAGGAAGGAAAGGAAGTGARGDAAGGGAGSAGSSAAMEWCAADIGSDDAAAAIAEAVGGRPVRMVVQAAGLPAAGPLATIEPDALGRAVALKCGGLLR